MNGKMLTDIRYSPAVLASRLPWRWRLLTRGRSVGAAGRPASAAARRVAMTLVCAVWMASLGGAARGRFASGIGCRPRWPCSPC